MQLTPATSPNFDMLVLSCAMHFFAALALLLYHAMSQAPAKKLNHIGYVS